MLVAGLTVPSCFLCFIWHLLTCYEQGNLWTKANRIFRGTQWEKHAICTNKMETRFASLWLHQSSTIRPQHGWPAGTGPALQPSCLAPWPHCLSATTKHKLVVIPGPLVKCCPKHPDFHLKGLFFFFFSNPCISQPPKQQVRQISFYRTKKKKKKIVCCHLQLLYNILCKTWKF